MGDTLEPVTSLIARTSRPPPDRSRRRYALLIDTLRHEYEQAVVLGTLATARELDARIVAIAGGPVEVADPRLRAKNLAFAAASEDNALGVLALSSVLGSAVGHERLGEWLARFGALPVYCMGVPIAGRLSVTVDNASGVAEAVRHLVTKHQKHNIGFVRGPVASHEAEVRYTAYREALLAHGITPDPRWVADGDYTRASGMHAVRAILDQKRVSVHALDAIICANDYMALGVLDELGRRGINVPEQIALIGFDDVASAAASRPALTTVRQPSDGLGREGMKQLALLASGNARGGDCVLPVELKVRRSCGCVGLDEPGLPSRVQVSGSGASFEVALMQRRQLIVAEVARAARGTFGAAGSDWESALLGALIEELRDGKEGALSRRVQRLLFKLEQGGGDLAATPAVLATLRRQALACVQPGSEARERLEDAVADAQQLATGLLVQAAVASARGALSRARAFSRRLAEELFGTSADVSRLLAEQLPGLGIDACIVATLMRDPGGDAARVSFGFSPSSGHPDPVTLPLSRLTEHPFVETARTLFVLPIVHGTEQLGLGVFSLAGQLQGDLLEDLREQLSTVLKVAQGRHA